MQLPSGNESTNGSLDNGTNRRPLPPIPLHTKPALKIAMPMPLALQNIEEVQVAKDQIKDVMAGGSPSDEEYWSAEEQPQAEVTALSIPVTQTCSSIANNGSDSDEEYWRNLPAFNFDDETFTAIFSSTCDDGAKSFSETASLATSGPSGPGASTLPHNNTPRSIAAHPLTPSRKKKKYYAVTKGQAIGVFDNWNITKAAVDGVNGVQQGYNTLQEAWDTYNQCRELGHLEIIQ